MFDIFICWLQEPETLFVTGEEAPLVINASEHDNYSTTLSPYQMTAIEECGTAAYDVSISSEASSDLFAENRATF